MPRYEIIIGSREVVIDAEALPVAQEAAMKLYPGETVHGYRLLAEQDETETTDDAETEAMNDE